MKHGEHWKKIANQIPAPNALQCVTYDLWVMTYNPYWSEIICITLGYLFSTN